MQRASTNDLRNIWKPLVIFPNATMALRMKAAFEELGFDDVTYVSQYPKAGALAGMLAQEGSNICILDVASNPEHGLLLISEAAAAVPVVALNPHNDADLILRCLRRGAGEFLSDASAEQVGEVLERLARQRIPAGPTTQGRVYCIMPGKAGCGASTLAAYLAIEMKRSGASKVLLVDTDSVTASVAFLLKLKSDFHLGDAVRDWSRMDDDLWCRLAVPCHGIDVLPAPENPATRIPIDQQAALGLLAFWREHYEATVLDLGGAHAPGFEFAGIADEFLLVTTNELAALHGTRRALECLQRVSVDRDSLKLIVTRYTPATGLRRDDVQTALRLEPYALLSNDYESVQAAVMKGEPVAMGSYFARSIRQLAEQLLGKEKTVKKRSAWFGLLAAKG